MNNIKLTSLIWVALSLFGSSLAADEVDFSKDVLPILSNKCFVCHGPDSEADELVRLDSLEAATADLGGYRAIDQASPEESELTKRIFSEDDPMPPVDAEKPLTEAERLILKSWVESGGDYAAHWAFVPPRKMALPIERMVHPVDSFLAAALERGGVEFAPAAEKRTLARRLSLTLCGLPPEPDELNEFLMDESDDATERYVNRLLEKPQFGEHQARYWLDAVRYGDTHGLHLDNRRGIFPYRDWVVRAINENLPVDQFIEWQLGGDLLPDATTEQLIASGFVRMNPTSGEGGAIAEEYQAKNTFDRTENIGTVFLGMTLTCARCHTHKYDPILQQEYYRLFAFFNSTTEPALDRNKYDYGPHIKVPADDAQWGQWKAALRERDQITQSVDNLLKTGGERIPESALMKWQKADSAERLDMLGIDAAPFNSLDAHRAAADLKNRMSQLQESFAVTLVAKELSSPRETRVLRRGEYNLPIGDPLLPGVPEVMGDFPEDAPRNRLGLAKWLTSPKHPLVARVLVNRYWQQIFGEGLVRTPEDFGLQGQQPTNPELLDWLAVEFQESGWDFKHIIRLMVTSRAFQQSSAWRTDLDDPENRLWSRGPSYRLDAEVIRDIGLWASGLLDDHMGGEGVKPYQPAGMWKALAHPGSNTKNYQPDSGKKIYRRSLYVYWKRTSPHPMMTLFDAPDRESSCVRRSRTSTALQSLALLNETQRTEMARAFAERLLVSSADDPSRLAEAFELLASRPPSEVESTVCLKLLAAMKSGYQQNPDDASALLQVGDATRDETLDCIEHAAWTQVAITLLASDLALLLY